MPIYKWSKTAASNGNSDPTINYLEGQAPSSINDSARAAMAAEAKFRDDISGTLTTTGSSTAYALATNSVFDTAALMSGAMITFIPHATSGASPTLAVDGLTARAINQSTGVAVTAGQLVLGTPIVVTYIHATTEFILQGMVGATDPLQLLSTDAGATVGPTLDLYRNSASPANSDFLGSVDFNGKDNGAAKQLYARLIAQITDVVAGTEDANILLQAVVAGVLTTMLQTTSGGVAIPGTLGVTGAASVGGTLSITGLIAATTGFAAPTVQRFLSGTAATYTAAAGVVRQRVRMVGGGGGGGARTTNAGTNGTNSSLQVNAAGTAWTAVFGAGGAAAGGGGAGGTTGTDGSTGALVVRFAGMDGGVAVMQTDPTGDGQSAFIGGIGGSSAFGGGGVALAASGGAAKTNSGGGGAGGMSAITVHGGGGGGAGEYVEFWVTGMTTATYTVGAKGTGGAAGGSAGGDGGAGIIIIEEFYS